MPEQEEYKPNKFEQNFKDHERSAAALGKAEGDYEAAQALREEAGSDQRADIEPTIQETFQAYKAAKAEFDRIVDEGRKQTGAEWHEYHQDAVKEEMALLLREQEALDKAIGDIQKLVLPDEVVEACDDFADQHQWERNKVYNVVLRQRQVIDTSGMSPEDEAEKLRVYLEEYYKVDTKPGHATAASRTDWLPPHKRT